VFYPTGIVGWWKGFAKRTFARARAVEPASRPSAAGGAREVTAGELS